MRLSKATTEDRRREIAVALGDLHSLRDEAKAHIPLARTEARDRWLGLEMRYLELLDALTTVREDTLDALLDALMDQRAALTELLDALERDPEC